MKTQPIAITQHHNRRRQRSHPPLYDDQLNSHFNTNGVDNSESEQNYENNEAKNFFCGSLNDLNSNMGALTVGSLPSSRRERRFIVSTGTHESIYSSQTNGVYPYQQTGDDDNHSGGGIGGALANSMAPPSAPFLSSRRGSAETIQSMPIMDLPESASEYSDPYKGAPHIIPYGSLCESRFHQRRIHHNPQQLQRLNNGFEPKDDPKQSGSYSRSYSNDSYFPQSMPVNKFERNIIQKRWEKYNQSDETVDSEPTHDSKLETDVPTSGIQKLLEGSSDNQSNSNRPISNLSSQLEDSKNAEFNDSKISELGKSIEISSLANDKDRLNKNDNGYVSGLGRSLQDPSAQITSSKSHQVSHDDSFALSHETSSANLQFVHAASITPNSLHLTPEYIGGESENQLSSSLTGLDILEFAKKSPGGLSVDLTKEEKDSLLGRARTYSDDGTKITNAGNNNSLASRFTHTPPKHLIANEGSMHMNPPKLLPPMNLGGPQLLSPNRHHNVYNAAYEGYSNGSISPQNPDIEGAFDLDFDE